MQCEPWTTQCIGSTAEVGMSPDIFTICLLIIFNKMSDSYFWYPDNFIGKLLSWHFGGTDNIGYSLFVMVQNGRSTIAVILVFLCLLKSRLVLHLQMNILILINWKGNYPAYSKKLWIHLNSVDKILIRTKYNPILCCCLAVLVALEFCTNINSTCFSTAS